jgi:hypothetical protein
MTDYTQTIAEIEKDIRETPYHKGTEHYIGKLRAKLARLKDRQLEGEIKSKGGGGGGGYGVKKQGDATVVLIGPPSAGKSTLINRLTNAESKVAAYSFTTVSVIPGMLKYNDAYIQILDVPGLIEGARQGKGRGKEVLSVARGADLLLIMTDVERVDFVKTINSELEDAGIRINTAPPEIRIEKKLQGGLNIQSNIPQALSKQTIKEVAMEYGLKNADIVLKEKFTLERLLDGFSQSRAYLPAIYVVNKIDKGKKPKENNFLNISAQTGEGIDILLKEIWEQLKLVRVYLVRPDEEPNYNDPIIAKRGTTLEEIAQSIGPEFAEGKKAARIWGASAQFPGQEIPLSTKVVEGLQLRFV